MDRRVVLGRVSGLFGVRGWVKLHSFTRPPDNLLAYRNLTLGSGPSGTRLRLEEGRRHGKTLIGRFAGIDDRDAAAALVGQELAVDRAELPETGSDEFYWADLIGLEVRNREGVVLGRVENIAIYIHQLAMDAHGDLYTASVYPEHAGALRGPEGPSHRRWTREPLTRGSPS